MKEREWMLELKDCSKTYKNKSVFETINIKNKIGTCILFRGAVAALYVALVIVSK
jgi:hypothetical protein